MRWHMTSWKLEFINWPRPSFGARCPRQDLKMNLHFYKKCELFKLMSGLSFSVSLSWSIHICLFSCYFFIQSYQRAVQLHPSFGSAHMNLAGMWHLQVNDVENLWWVRGGRARKPQTILTNGQNLREGRTWNGKGKNMQGYSCKQPYPEDIGERYFKIGYKTQNNFIGSKFENINES